MDGNSIQWGTVPIDPKSATKYVAEVLFDTIYPIMLVIRNKLRTQDEHIHEDVENLQEMFALCSSQIKKGLQNLFQIFKTEYRHDLVLQDSRLFNIERLSWCVKRLISIEQCYNSITDKKTVSNEVVENTSLNLMSPMYFVNWIDHTFEVLARLAEIAYKVSNNTDEIHGQSNNDLIDCLDTLHLAIDELLLSAMTLCEYCLPNDQHIVKARCQVVLRESKALFNELTKGEFDPAFKPSPELLKLPIMPSNVNVLIDVLKDVLYALETNTNNALLALLIHCFSNSVLPVDILRGHFRNPNGSCQHDGLNEDIEDCAFVKDFDLYSERLLQIGSFAVSCSSDQSRILSVRSGLASLEALDPHLVPAIMVAPDGQHTSLLMDSWRQEVLEIRNSVFLIVDPAAFAEKSKQLMHEKLLDITKEMCIYYDNNKVCAVINLGCIIQDFFAVYISIEPDALASQERLIPLLSDLDKVVLECKIVSNLLSNSTDFKYDVKKIKNNKEPTIDQLVKRLKLLYTVVNRINALLHPRDNEDQLFEDIEEVQIKTNVTHTVYAKNTDTFVNSPRNIGIASRSIFARTKDLRSTNKLPLSKLTQHLRSKHHDLSFSVQLDKLFNLSEVNPNNNETSTLWPNKQLQCIRERSILYNFSPAKRSSLRKTVLNRYCKAPVEKFVCKNSGESSMVSEKESFMDEATSLQITDILNQMNDLTNTFSATKHSRVNSTCNVPGNIQKMLGNENKNHYNVLKINVNDGNTTVSKHVWNIPVNANSMEILLDDNASNVTIPSNVTTLERISDIDLVESKLSSLKSLEETSL